MIPLRIKDDFKYAAAPPVEMGGRPFKLMGRFQDLHLNSHVPRYLSPDAASDSENAEKRRATEVANGDVSYSIAYYAVRQNGNYPRDAFAEPQKQERYQSHYNSFMSEIQTKVQDAQRVVQNLPEGKANEILKSDETPSGLSYAALGIIVDKSVDDGVTYVKDIERYGIEDFHQHPFETAYFRMGDCEDYAHLKRQMLRDLGVPNDKVYVLAGNRIGADGQKEGHAVTVIRDNISGDVVIDNDDEASVLPLEDFKKKYQFTPTLLIDDTALYVDTSVNETMAQPSPGPSNELQNERNQRTSPSMNGAAGPR